jgi:hypothetical protein
LKKRYILRTVETREYVGRGRGNRDNPATYGLHEYPDNDEDWRPSRKICELERMNWSAHALRTGVECPEFEIVEK